MWGGLVCTFSLSVHWGSLYILLSILNIFSLFYTTITFFTYSVLTSLQHKTSKYRPSFITSVFGDGDVLFLWVSWGGDLVCSPSFFSIFISAALTFFIYILWPRWLLHKIITYSLPSILYFILWEVCAYFGSPWGGTRRPRMWLVSAWCVSPCEICFFSSMSIHSILILLWYPGCCTRQVDNTSPYFVFVFCEWAGRGRRGGVCSNFTIVHGARYALHLFFMFSLRYCNIRYVLFWPHGCCIKQVRTPLPSFTLSVFWGGGI